MRAANPIAVIARIVPAAMASASGLGDVHEGSFEAGVAVGSDTMPVVTSGALGAGSWTIPVETSDGAAAGVAVMPVETSDGVAGAAGVGAPTPTPALTSDAGAAVAAVCAGLRPTVDHVTLNVQAGNTKVALVIDDLASVRPWSPRYLRIYGTAELVERQGQFGPGPYMQITPIVSWSFNLEGRSFTHDREVIPRRTVQHAAGPASSPSAPRATAE